MRQLLFLVVLLVVASPLFAQEKAVDPDRFVRFESQIQKQLADYKHGDFLYQNCDIFRKIMDRQAEAALGEVFTPEAADIDVHDTSIIGDITQTTSDENETSVAINRANPNIIVAGANDAAMYSIGMPIYLTTNAGAQWHTIRMPSYPVESTMPGGDPVLAAGPDSMLYYAYLIYDNPVVNGQDGISDLIVAHCTNGITWTHGSPVLGNQEPARTFEDKETIAADVDPTSPYYGRLYIAWVHYDDNFSSEYQMIAWSDDAGNTWSEPVQLSDSTGYFSCIRVGAHGVVFLSSSTTRRDETDWMMVSRDGGQTFQKNRIAQYVDYPANRDSRPSLKGIRGFRAFPYTTFDVDRSNNQLYLTYGSWEGSYASIYATTSKDEGKSWSEPRMIGSNGLTEVDHFLPWVSVDQVRHEARVSFYSSEDDPTTNVLTRFNSTLFDAPTAVEPIGNDTFDPLTLTRGGLPFIGDYVGADAHAGYYAAVWTENRKGHTDGDVYAYVLSPYTRSVLQINESAFSVSQPFPTPSVGGSVEFDITSKVPGSLVVTVSDALARPVMTGHFAPSESASRFSLDLSKQAPGVYHVVFSSGGDAVERCVVVGTN